MIRRLFVAAGTLLVLSLSGTLFGQAVNDSLVFARALWDTRPLAEGVQWRQYHFKGKEKLFGANQYVSLLVVDQGTGKYRFQVAIEPGKRQRTSRAAEEAGALAAINGSFYQTKPPYLPVGFLKAEGRILQDKSPSGRYVMIDSEGRLTVECTGEDPSLREEPEIVSTYTPMLVQEGKPLCGTGDTYRAPRTAVGVRGDTVLLLVVDGRAGRSRGVSLEETAKLMQWLGAEEALNLDGGGSSTLYIRGERAHGVVNHPSDALLGFSHRGERAVGHSILLLEKRPKEDESTAEENVKPTTN